MTQIKKMTEDELAQVFANEYRWRLSWSVRGSHPGEPHCWFVDGRLDEYGISARDLGRSFLNQGATFTPQRFGTDISDDRVYKILDRAKKRLTVR